MADGHVSPVLRHIRKIIAKAGAAPTTDAELLKRFTTEHDEASFEALLQRYGPLVWSTCRRVLVDVHAAEDAFQAAFLVLIRKASSLKRGGPLGPWLYGVAYRIAIRARTSAAKRRSRQMQMVVLPQTDALEELAWRDLRPILDEEVQRLPAKERVPFVLCYLEGKTNEQAAADLGCPKGTVLSRLSRARERLRVRLTRRGVVLSAGILTTILAERATSAAVPAPLGSATTHAAVLIAAGQTVPATVSSHVVALTEGAMRSMFLTRLALVLLVVAGFLGAGAGLFQYAGPALEAAAGDEPKKDKLPQPPGNAAEEGRSFCDVASQRDGVVLLVGTETKEGEKVPAGRLATLKLGEELKKYRVLKRGDKVVIGQLLARLDDRLAREELAIAQAKLGAAQAERSAAESTRDETKQRWDTAERLSKKDLPTISEEDRRGAKLTYERYYFETISKAQAALVATRELNKAQVILSMYEIRSPVNGTIRTIFKHPGEGVRALEPVLRIDITDGE